MIINKENHVAPQTCDSCEAPAKIMMMHYGEKAFCLCCDCAKQLARKLLEDICEIDTKAGRHG